MSSLTQILLSLAPLQLLDFSGDEQEKEKEKTILS